MSAKETIKILLIKRNMTITKLAEEITKRTGHFCSRTNLSNKINRSSLNYDEVEDIAKILNYKINFEDLEQ